jgi:putative MFS transporter
MVSNWKALSLPVVICALGYFVDIYDLVLFSIVRVASLKDLGVADADLLKEGVFLLNMQMTGMLVGGILWGVLGDKRGRISVLFGSILLYSLANIANAFVTDVPTYGVLRFIAGVGLAGELGAAITLVSEVLPKEIRGIGTGIVAGVGVSGAIAAGLIGKHFSWQTAFIVGGILGLMLLVMRYKLVDSSMFHSAKTAAVDRGNFLMLFNNRQRFLTYLMCILIGVPIWFVIGVLMTFSPELAAQLGVKGSVSAGSAIMYSYFGLIVGDFASAVGSQWLKSRRKIVIWFLAATLILVVAYLNIHGLSVNEFYGLCVALGIGIGYWAIFVTIAAEQFGTNLRATVATTVPNFVRGAVVAVTLAFQALIPHVGIVQSAMSVGVVCFSLAFIAIYFLPESFHKDLNYLEKA